jgi:poly(3-hydroxybutyrate) depolymerase
MDSTGYLYVPANCASGSTVCKLHVALHGCLQSYNNISDKFINNTGYNKWADTNNIIVLYPQAIPDNTSHSTWDSGSLANPNGCWDWIGWYGSNADQKGGVQMAAIVNMVNKITSGYNAGSGTTTTTTTTTTSGATTTTTAAATTTTTTATTTTTTAATGYTQTKSETVLAAYLAGDINVTQYNTLGLAYGYNTTMTFYYCPSLGGWTNHANCSAAS